MKQIRSNGIRKIRNPFVLPMLLGRKGFLRNQFLLKQVSYETKCLTASGWEDEGPSNGAWWRQEQAEGILEGTELILKWFQERNKKLSLDGACNTREGHINLMP